MKKCVVPGAPSSAGHRLLTIKHEKHWLIIANFHSHWENCVVDWNSVEPRKPRRESNRKFDWNFGVIRITSSRLDFSHSHRFEIAVISIWIPGSISYLHPLPPMEGGGWGGVDREGDIYPPTSSPDPHVAPPTPFINTWSIQLTLNDVIFKMLIYLVWLV